ncbi:hypothetical protein KY342_04750 [Candidatus Woesearchaeota archaeon]|nr:hypothetical protein [Candidatus Woesearchaeota archaeon]
MIGKKSQHELMFIVFQLLMIAAIFALLMLYVNSLREQTLFTKIALSRDLAFVVDTVYAAPGNLEYTYYATELNLSEFDYKFEKQNVNVLEKDLPTLYPFGEDRLFLESRFMTIKNPKTIQFQNIGYKFLAEEQTEAKPNLFKYPYIDTFDLNWANKKIAVGFYNENNLAKSIARELGVVPEGVARITNADILIIAEIDNKTSKTLRIEIPINSKFIKQNRKLASIIMNNVLERGNTERALIVPLEISGLGESDIGVLIVKSEDIPIGDVSQVIKKSLRQYYG